MPASPFRLVQADAASNPEDRPPAAVELSVRVEGDSVSIRTLVFFDAFDELKDPDTTDRLPSKEGGVYSGRMNQSVTLSGLAQFGLEPVRLKIVSAKDPDAAPLKVVSRARSVSVTVVNQYRNRLVVALHNTSAQTVVEYTVCNSECQNTRAPALILPGETTQVPVPVLPSGHTTPNGFVVDPPPASVILEGAVFADGHLEGNRFSKRPGIVPAPR